MILKPHEKEIELYRQTRAGFSRENPDCLVVFEEWRKRLVARLRRKRLLSSKLNYLTRFQIEISNEDRNDYHFQVFYGASMILCRYCNAISKTMSYGAAWEIEVSDILNELYYGEFN